MTTITGDKALDRRLKRLGGKGASKAARAGVRAALTPVAQAMRKAVTASDASADLKRAARKTISSRFAKSMGRGEKQAKVGFGVGKKKEAKRSGNNRGGVGVGSANIHWFALGTQNRSTGDGHHTGRVEAVFAGLAEQALNASKAASLEKARKKIAQVIDKEARR